MRIVRFGFPLRELARVVIVASVLSWQLSPAQTILDYNFDSHGSTTLKPGEIAGQDGWAIQNSTNALVSPIIYPCPAGSWDATQALGGNTAGKPLATNSTLFAAGAITSNMTLTLSFDVCTSSAYSSECFGIGESTYPSSGGQSPLFGVFGGNWALRPANNAEVLSAVDSSGASLKPTPGHWYSVQSIWNLKDRTETLAIMDRTAGATTYTPLYFDAGQKTVTGQLGTQIDMVSSWNTVYVRTTNDNAATSAGGGFMDNLKVVVGSGTGKSGATAGGTDSKNQP